MVRGRSYARAYLPDETKVEQAKREDIPGGAGRMLDIAVKYDGDAECYVHTPENFFAPGMKPPNHRLNSRQYEVIVSVESENGAQATSTFMLENLGNRASDLILRETIN